MHFVQSISVNSDARAFSALPQKATVARLPLASTNSVGSDGELSGAFSAAVSAFNVGETSSVGSELAHFGSPQCVHFLVNGRYQNFEKNGL
jgi:hypothetical protein